MPPVKHTTLRLKPYIRALIEHLSEIEHRDLTNMIEVCVLEYAKKHNVRVPVVNETTPKEEADTAIPGEETK